MQIERILKSMQIDELNEMQKSVVQQHIPKKDFVLYAPTGSGKTLAFCLILTKYLQQKINNTQVLIIVPSRELALQIENVTKKVNQNFKVTCCYGGNSTKTERNKLRDAPAIIVGTPGRLLYHFDRNHINSDNLTTVVLDEFDKSLEFGFQPQMESIIKYLPNLTTRILTSATKMEEIPSFSGLNDYVLCDFSSDKQISPNLKIKKIISPAKYKLRTLFDLLCSNGSKKTLIFCNHRDAVDHISELLEDRDITHDLFHGGLEQTDRELAILKFKNNSNRILIATDLAARGLDIPEIDSIIHYQLPYQEDSFIHRNGRTARMQAQGEVYVLLNPEENYPYLPEHVEEIKLDGEYPLPPKSPYVTLYVTGGKKDKISKTDILGFLLSFESIEKAHIGLIEIKDQESYVAVDRSMAIAIIKGANNGKVKGRKVRIGRT
ncbi:DEAD/DEAH box helicase [Sphingobacterium sp. UT-1RO-CII-1]|uniref:DEAD/DEAH box helicase n=1 Tax=Sphingobacterium sp. UT-1RO-CII-1 TaxID=2995225 RepID=UPI00227AD3EB|nr:DEAD/DEAH box helicase [Sphingobacterium sp. UT-1RO-CII-1]MCY4778990.1 DEAD/DEAH box helicase [Sphingobacterium sp. UT-1RO-CII-1]